MAAHRLFTTAFADSGHQPYLLRLSLMSLLSTNLELDLGRINDKAKAAERRARKTTGPRFLREAMDDSRKDPGIAGLPIVGKKEGNEDEQNQALKFDGAVTYLAARMG